MKKKNIYINVNSYNFWWGIYGLCDKTSWEDVIFYQKYGRGFKKLALTCICTKTYFESNLEDLMNDPNEKAFVDRTIDFLGSQQMQYYYYYDNPDDIDFYEVQYKAKCNESGIKPRSIETWYPSDGIDKGVLDNCAKAFCKQFLDIEVNNVYFKEIVSFEDAMISYLEYMKSWEQNPKIIFTEELIEKITDRLNVPKDKAFEILNHSIRQGQ